MNPASAVERHVTHALALAETWPRWNGTPIRVDDRVYTPHKALRRITDHLIDHLAEMEARLAGLPTFPDHWHASAITTPADLAPFTERDLEEARSRLTRLAQIWSARLGTLDDARLDLVEGDAWTLREVALHVADDYYADAVGSL
ncbi:hypothetical protein [Actinoplanes sp. NPDC051851]|uniref:hypothetical protein n=1 Tax=Actinoplanes sp. NPDC051851 TaxID=3154753 RepID=UPI003420FDAF